MEIVEGDIVTINFSARLKDGDIFDTSLEDIAREEGIYIEGKVYEPVTFTVGGNAIITGMSKYIVGMKAGEEKEFTLDAEEAYGHNDEYPVEKVPIETFKNNNITPESGLEIETDKGFALVTNVGEKEVELQYFHPLAGQEITFWVRVEKVEKRRL